MPRTRLKCLYCYTTACVLWLALHAAVLRGQTPSETTAPDTWHFQYDLFQLLLERQGLIPVTKVEQAFAEPKDSVLIIAGNLSRLPARASSQLSRFAQNGGTLLLATDSPSNVPGIARFMKGPVKAGDPENVYQGFADCVKVTAIAEDLGLAGVSTIVTNRSSWLVPDAGGPLNWDIVATFPDGCFPPASQGQPLLAIGHSPSNEAGVVVLSADASLFTNGMLWHGDNALLAIRVSSLLAGSGRTRLAFWSDGEVLATSRNRIDSQAVSDQANVQGQVPLPEPELKKVLKLANALTNEVARSNVINETLKQRPRYSRPSRYFRFLLVMATGVMFLGAVWVLATSGTLRPFATPGRNLNTKNAPSQRALPANTPGDYRTPAGYLAREFCWELTGSRHSTDWQKYLARQLIFEPTLSTSDQQELAKIFDIASRGCREQMNGSDFQQLGKAIAALRAKHNLAQGSANHSNAAEHTTSI